MDPRGELLSHADLKDTARLLHDVFRSPQFEDERYLDWYYRKNPLGPAIETDIADDVGRLGHIGGIPHFYHSTSGVLQAMFPLNVAVHERARGRGVMGRLTSACYEETRRRWGNALLIGMANANSVAFYTTKGGYRCVMQMPVRLAPPLWPSLGRVTHTVVDAAYLSSPAFRALVGSLDLEPTEGWSQRWTAEVLAWRLGKPGGGYVVHEGKHAVVVTCRERRHGLPFAVVLKTFRRKSAPPGPVVVNDVVASACRNRRAVMAVYAGFSATTRLLGVRIPERYKPAPLNLCVSSQPEGFVDLASFRYDTFEFLEFDVY